MILRKVRDQLRTTGEDLVNDLKRAGTTVSTVTISNTLHRHGLKSCSVCKVPLLKPAHVQAHLNFAKDHLDDPEEAWEKVMWSDETKIQLFGINSTCCVWRKKKDEYNPKNTITNKSLLCANLVKNYRKRLTSVIVNNGFLYQISSSIFLLSQILISCNKMKKYIYY